MVPADAPSVDLGTLGHTPSERCGFYHGFQRFGTAAALPWLLDTVSALFYPAFQAASRLLGAGT